MKCYASDYCQKDKSSCSDVCGGYRVLRALYNLSRIPERYRYTIALKPENGEDLEAFTKLDRVKVRRGSSLSLYLILRYRSNL